VVGRAERRVVALCSGRCVVVGCLGVVSVSSGGRWLLPSVVAVGSCYGEGRALWLCCAGHWRAGRRETRGGRGCIKEIIGGVMGCIEASSDVDASSW